MGVFIKVTVVLVTYLEEDNVLLSLSALLCANSSDVSQWTAHTVNNILTAGDDMYLKAFQEKSIPDTETISLAYLPDRIRWSAIITLDPYTSNRPSSEAQITYWGDKQ